MFGVRTIYNIVAKYRKRNSTNYLSKDKRRKTISDQQLQTLNNKADVNERRRAHRFSLSQ